MFATAAVLAASLVGPLTAIHRAAAAGWTYVYGDAGPDDYSRYQDVALAPDGSTYMTGFFSGAFAGLASPNAYHYFLQRVGTDGSVIWTVEIPTSQPLDNLSIPTAPQVIVDGLGNEFVQATVGTSSEWIAFDAAGDEVESFAVPGSFIAARMSPA
ncbi:MAG TPA: hypothetical protein VGM78_03625, partial [Ilumatobacteraceae bacterium]